MLRNLVFIAASVLAACAGSTAHGSDSPASPRAQTGAPPPAYTSLASTDTPGIVGESSAAPETDDHAHEQASSSSSPSASEAPRDEGTTASANPPGSPADAERVAFERARPVFEQYCSPCHTTRGARHTAATLRHFSMDRYPFGGHHTATMGPTIREVLGAAGEPASMPADHPGAVQGEELALVLAWAGAWEHARSAIPSSTGSAPPTTAAPAHSHHHKPEPGR